MSRVRRSSSGDGGDGRSDVGETVGEDEQVAVDHAAARVHDVGHVAVTLVLVGNQKGFLRDDR